MFTKSVSFTQIWILPIYGSGTNPIRNRLTKNRMYGELIANKIGNEDPIRFDVIGDSFLEAKARICAIINSYYQ